MHTQQEVPDAVSTFALGMTVGLISMLISSLGETAIRLSALRAQRAAVERPPWKRPMWFFGLTCILLAAPLDASSIVLVPLSSITIVYALKQPTLAILARVVLAEPIACLCWTGIGMIAVGAGVSLAFAPQTEKDPFVDYGDFFTPQITPYMTVSLCIIAALWVNVFCRQQRRVGKEGISIQDLCMPIMSAWLLAIANLFKSAWGRIPADAEWYEWIWVTVAVVVLAGGVFFVDVSAMERMSTHIYMPVGFGFSACINGVQGFLLGEFEGMPQQDILLWGAGLLAAVVGTVLVAYSSSKEQKEVEEQDEFLAANEDTYEAMEKVLSTGLVRSTSQLGSRTSNNPGLMELS